MSFAVHFYFLNLPHLGRCDVPFPRYYELLFQNRRLLTTQSAVNPLNYHEHSLASEYPEITTWCRLRDGSPATAVSIQYRYVTDWRRAGPTPGHNMHRASTRRRAVKITRSHPEMVGDMTRVTLNFDLSKIPFVHF